MNIFERACRRKLRFASSVGLLAAEDLFCLPLVDKGNRPSLNNIGVAIMEELKAMGEFSLVDTKPNDRKEELELQLEIVKHVIESKKADAAAAETRQINMEKRKKLAALLADKQDEKLKGLSEEQILAELAKLDA